MYYSPFSVITNFFMPDGKGLYARPWSLAAPKGWGEPRYTEDGTKIDPGTVGGPFPNVHITNGGQLVITKYLQKAGCITWWGPLIDPDDESRGRMVLSYHGPKLRYFLETGFIYGNSPDHNEIYCRGGYFAIAPAPVLGAALTSVTSNDPVTGQPVTKQYIVVAVWENGKDTFYRKEATGIVSPEDMTDELRAAMMARFHATDNPRGWRVLGSASPPTGAYSAETPWFFSEDGTKATRMSRGAFTFDNGGSLVTEDRFTRLQATLSGTSVLISSAGNDPAMTYTEEWTKVRVPEYVSEDLNGNHHTWREDHIDVQVDLIGSQIVAADYVGNELWLGRMQYSCRRRNINYFTLGTDPDPYYGDVNPQATNQSNYGEFQGPLPKPEGYVASQGDHYYTTWLNFVQLIELEIGPDGDPVHTIELHKYVSATSDEWAGLPFQEDNPRIYAYGRWDRSLVGGLDMRKLFAVAKDTSISATVNASVTYDVNTIGSYIHVGNDEKVTKLARHQTKTTGTFISGFSRIQVQEDLEPDFTYLLQRTTYVGDWPPDNWYGELRLPGSKVFYSVEAGALHTTNWPTIPELLYGQPATDCAGNAVQTENGLWAINIEVPALSGDAKSVLLSSTSQGGTLESLIGYGNKSYPLGAC